MTAQSLPPPVPQTSRRSKAKSDRRDQLLNAAERLIAEHGYLAVRLEDIGAVAGVSGPAIYRHFADKQTLLYEVCSLQFTRLHEHLDAVMAREAEPTERLRACGRAYVEFGLAHPEAYRIMFMSNSDWGPQTYEDEVLADQGAFMALVRVVDEVIAGLGIEHDPFESSIVLWTAMHGITSLLISKPNFPWPPVDRLVDDVCDAHLRGTFGQE